jgi:hypothetical protein
MSGKIFSYRQRMMKKTLEKRRSKRDEVGHDL